jgi:6-phosphofructokinase 1
LWIKRKYIIILFGTIPQFGGGTKKRKGLCRIMKRIGMLTSGGDCQALNAAMRGVVKGLSNNVDELEVYGFYDGYKGLIYGEYRLLTSTDFSGILTKGGTILGSSRQPFKLMRVPDENGLDKVEAMKQTYYKLNLDCLVILGGNGTQKTANLLREEGLNIIHLPKTIDNDIYGTDVTFGFQSAINIATDCIDCIHTTAASHNRVFIVEVMGHKVGWLTLYAGIAGGADIILLPEIPYDIDKVIEAIEKRTKAGKGFTILAVAEGAISKKDAKLSKKEYKKKLEKSPYPSVSYEVADMIKQRTGTEVRVTVPGHTQRGGSPTPYDRVLCSRLGAAAAEAILEEDYGYMIGIVKNETARIPLEKVAGKLKVVEPDCQIIREAKTIGISFGD